MKLILTDDIYHCWHTDILKTLYEVRKLIGEQYITRTRHQTKLPWLSWGKIHQIYQRALWAWPGYLLAKTIWSTPLIILCLSSLTCSHLQFSEFQIICSDKMASQRADRQRATPSLARRRRSVGLEFLQQSCLQWFVPPCTLRFTENILESWSFVSSRFGPLSQLNLNLLTVVWKINCRSHSEWAWIIWLLDGFI